MKKKFIVFSVLLLLIGIFITSKTGDNLIGFDLVDEIYYPFVWSLVFVPLSFIALVLNNEKHKYWLKLTGIFFVVSMVLVYMMPEYDPGIVSMDRELTNWFLAGVYSVVSLIYFIVQFIKNKRSNNII